jgi:hypothetical protein
MLELETVVIEHPDLPGERIIINKRDFNPAIHKLFKPKKPSEIESEPGAGAEVSDGGSEAEAPRRRGRRKAAAAETDAYAEANDEGSEAEAPKRRGRKKATETE